MPIYQPRRLDTPAVHPRELITHGPIVPVVVRISEREAQIRGDRPAIKINALLDTGACGTVVSARIAQYLQLTSIDKVTSVGVHGAGQERSVYSVDFTFDGSQINFEKWRVIEADLENGPTPAPIDMLIGRDVLSWIDFRYDGAKAGFSMEIPSPSHPGHPNHPDNRPTAANIIPVKVIDQKKRKTKASMTKASRKKNRK